MIEMSKREKQAEWICRILISLDVYLMASGYIAYFQAKYQLETPLIPRSVLYDVTTVYMKAASFTAIGLFAGLWLYFFRKKTMAIVLLAAAALLYESILLFFRK